MTKKSETFPVMLQVQGKAAEIVDVPKGGATLRSALSAAGHNPENYQGSVTIDGQAADLSDRLKRGQLIAVTPKVAGGSR